MADKAHLGSKDSFGEDYGSLDLSFDDIAELDPDEPLKKPGKDGMKSSSCDNGADLYILGTLIIRVVAARDLEPAETGGLFRGKGSANPYASVRFGSTTQRTSQVFSTLDPIWPRGETMYMDVTHPLVEHEKTENTKEEASPVANPVFAPKHPGDPPSKAAKASSSSTTAPPILRVPSKEEVFTAAVQEEPARPDDPILTVAVFHASDNGKLQKFPNKLSGDSDDVFLGMTAISLTPLLTGKIRTLDEWFPLSGCSGGRATVRVVCEYEASDPPPRHLDLVKFTGYCHPADLYPVIVDRVYTVEESEGDNVLISSVSPEGWVSSFLVHRYMLICVERHHGAMDLYQEEMVSIAQRLSHSPLIHVVQESVGRVPDEGLVNVAASAVQGGASLLTRWLQGGLGTVVQDVAYATNWNGELNPDAETSLSTGALDDEDTSESPASVDQRVSNSTSGTDSPDSLRLPEPLPNMPSCPITQEPMREPVVAADGHTYERAAIVRWFKTSDKSPLTGSVLPHKNLVPNYMLLSSIQEASARVSAISVKGPPMVVEDDVEDLDDEQLDVQTIDEDDEETTEVQID